MGGIFRIMRNTLSSGRLYNMGARATTGTLAMEPSIDSKNVCTWSMMRCIKEAMLHMDCRHALNADHLARPHSSRHDGNHSARFRTSYMLFYQSHLVQGQKLSETVFRNKISTTMKRAITLSYRIVKLNTNRPIGRDLRNPTYQAD